MPSVQSTDQVQTVPFSILIKKAALSLSAPTAEVYERPAHPTSNANAGRNPMQKKTTIMVQQMILAIV